ncbi:MAG: hypothetical protein QOK40_3437, partial [Miltoncostaeaceae bacterium]|nr:hypothetical protein [Miltoncostaeaceae bacterium]
MQGLRPAAAVAAPRDAGVARAYARAVGRLGGEGRAVVQQLIDGDVAAVYRRGSPRLRAEVPLAEVERLPLRSTVASGRDGLGLAV